jgi:lipid-A-disaccharide synthase
MSTVISPEWQDFLYPLGFLASLAFFSRFYLQSLLSERAGYSHVTRSFWVLSGLGNALLLSHSWIQVQYPVGVIQALNLIISIRNWELSHVRHPARSCKWVLCAFPLSVLLLSLLFWLRAPAYSFSELHWMRASHRCSAVLSPFWHIVGWCGMTLFATRFWIQWAETEARGESHLSARFWSLSLLGGILSFLYFCRLGDTVHILGYGTGLAPYLYNLHLMNSAKRASV